MSKAIMNRYRELLTQQADARKLEIDLAVEIRILEKEMELAAIAPKAGGNVFGNSEKEDFIERNGHKLERDDFEFMANEYRGTTEVNDHTSIPASTLKRLAKDGKIEASHGDRRNWEFQTLSVMRYLLDLRDEA